MDKVQQTIIMISRFPDGNGGFKKLRTGKLISQGAHAAMAFLSQKFRNSTKKKISGIDESGNYFEEYINIPEPLTEEEELWIQNSFTKICLYVDSEEELLDIYEKAKLSDLTAHLITDSGLTEFNGIPTITCLALGPHFKSKFDPLTKDLKLF